MEERRNGETRSYDNLLETTHQTVKPKQVVVLVALVTNLLDNGEGGAGRPSFFSIQPQGARSRPQDSITNPNNRPKGSPPEPPEIKP